VRWLMTEIGKLAIAIELDGVSHFVCFKEDQKELIVSMIQVATGGKLVVKKAPDNYNLEEVDYSKENVDG